MSSYALATASTGGMTVALCGVALAIVSLIVAWFSGWLGRSAVTTIDEADARLDQIAARLASANRSSATDGPAPTSPEAGPSLRDAASPAAPSSGANPGLARRNPAILDAAIPGSLAFANGAIDWFTPDHAAMVALSQGTHTEITNAFDLHRTLSEHQYHLMTEGSLTNWSGHVAEAQIADQIDAWAGTGTAVLAQNSNFAGADVSVFDHDFQVKFYSDFSDINNIHGDTLIVNEDAANIPSDALHVDFSEPFDPSILDGHDVIVAEGLTLAGADDAWESAGGLWAGGLDAGDALDAAGDALIPGIGAAIRVGMSGYKRREALRDGDLRARASGRVVRDAAYGVAGAGGGALAGSLLGGLVDVASLGMTLGAGAWVGGMIGAAYGGKKAGDTARASDHKAVKDARTHAANSVAAYGLAVEKAQSQAQDDWTQAVAGADAEAAKLAAVRLSQTRHVERLTLDDLSTMRSMGREEADSLIRSAADRVLIAQGAQRSPRARRRQQAWTARATGLRRSMEQRGGVDVHDVLVLVVASPDGADQAISWLQDRISRRTTVLASADALMTALQRQSLADRLFLAASLANERTEIQDRAAKTLAAPIRRVEGHVDKLKDELVIAGYVTRGDVARLGPGSGRNV